MPSQIPLFCAKYLIFLQVILGLVAVTLSLPHHRHLVRRRWLVSALGTFLLSGLLALVLGVLVPSPRPFVVDHLKPLFPHAPSNGFPSHHALLAAAVVAVVSLLDIGWASVLGMLAVAVDWGRVACHVHHVNDVVGANLIVLISMMLSVRLARMVRMAPSRGQLRPVEWSRRRPELDETRAARFL